ncbi:hypothetical protein [Bradyrhizobium liaoningense]|uniref:hypothetical protein n=1 Tax=Bradyrhizobium liaoningense TaxID=43992 RepID=UPI001BA4C4AE|nr:hypothetical protein [Bradyrhizobium liaoningense]MBR0717864.1 hypothetical protein [Bradyrhizobium liaoningense]
MTDGFCNPKRLELSARAYAEEFGEAALASLLRTLAGVSRVEDVELADRFRVNQELRKATNGADMSPFARLQRRAYANVTVRK